MLDDARIKELQQSTGHSVFSPSSMKRIMSCPGSVLAELNSPIPETSIYAAKGTLLHEYCEVAMKHGLDNDTPNVVIDYVWDQDWEFDDKLLVVEALEYVLGIIAKHTMPVQVELEAKGSLEQWGLPEVYGTMDVRVESATRIDVVDYKFGYGIQVFAENNPQCGCYLGGAVPFNSGSEPAQKLRVHIVQPTLNHMDVWKVGWKELCQLILIDITESIQQAKIKDPLYDPSMEACRFCNAKMGCEHRQKGIKQNAYDVVKASKNPSTVDKTQWKKYLDAADALQQAIKDIRLFAQDEIRSGRGFPGYKMVAGRSARKWIDENKAEVWLRDAGYGDKDIYAVQKLLSFPQAEKKLKGLKKNPAFSALMEKKEGKPVLQPDSHPKTALVFAVSSVFADVAANDENVKKINGL